MDGVPKKYSEGGRNWTSVPMKKAGWRIYCDCLVEVRTVLKEETSRD